MGSKTDGLVQKYEVKRTDGKAMGWCFVLEELDPLARHALLAYAAAAREAGYLALADDLEARVRTSFEWVYARVHRGVLDERSPMPAPPDASTPPSVNAGQACPFCGAPMQYMVSSRYMEWTCTNPPCQGHCHIPLAWEAPTTPAGGPRAGA